MICGANFHHPKYFQGGNATEKIMVSQMPQASHVFSSLEKKSSLNVRFSRWESKWKYSGCLSVAQDGTCLSHACHALHTQSEELPVQRHRALHRCASSSAKWVTCPHRAMAGALIAQINGCGLSQGGSLTNRAGKGLWLSLWKVAAGWHPLALQTGHHALGWHEALGTWNGHVLQECYNSRKII